MAVVEVKDAFRVGVGCYFAVKNLFEEVLLFHHVVDVFQSLWVRESLVSRYKVIRRHLHDR